MKIPNNWTLVTNSSKGHYNTENYNIKLKENSLNGNNNTIIDLQKGFFNDESLSMLFLLQILYYYHIKYFCFWCNV